MRKLGLSGSYTTISLGANLTAYTDSGLSPSSQYLYKVHAYNSVGSSADSAEISVTTPAAPKPPAAPSNLTGSALSSTQIRVQWTDNSTDEAGFRLLRKLGLSGSYTTISLGANLTAYTDSGLSPSSQYFYKVHAYNSVGNSADSAEISVTTPANAPSTGTTGAFLTTDSSTAGSWNGVYGSEGFSIAAYANTLPPSLSVHLARGQMWTWQYSTPQLAALERPESATERIASCWYSSDFVQLNIQTTDRNSHRLAVYCLDYDRSGRQQTLELVNADTGAIIDSRVISNFGAGIWVIYSVSGNLIVRAQRVTGPNAVISGLFFDPSGATPIPPEPEPTPTNTTRTASIRFLGANTATGGTWKGVFGREGFQLAGESAKLPSYAGGVTFAGKTDHVWNWSTTDTAALQKSSAADRLAACWYASSSFDVRVNPTDTQTHKVSFYCLDWDMANRTQKVEALDSETGALLHSTTVSGFQKGTYLSYDFKGSVIFRFTRTGPYNAVVSGLFFDASSSPL
jgi:hypothetical protein